MSKARRRARRRAWLRYVRRNDDLVYEQPMTYLIQHPMRMNPGYFRQAEGWNTQSRWCRDLRHGV